MKTKSISEIESKMSMVPPGSYRYLVLTAARDFKSAWIELGSHLTKIRDGSIYKEWGYNDFETYCQKELHIKKATAHKLTATYSFMERHEPDILRGAMEQSPAERRLPPFEVLDVLSRAEEKGQIGPTEYREFRDHVFQEDPPPNATGLRRFLGQHYPEPAKEEASPEAHIRRWARTARRLADDCEQSPLVSTAIKERAGALAVDFEELVRQSAA